MVREAAGPPYQPRRLLTLDVHDEIDPTTREWVTVDETGHAFMDVDEARAEARGAAFETWLGRQSFNSDQLRLLHLVKEQIKANAAELTVSKAGASTAAAVDERRFRARPRRVRRRGGARAHPRRHEPGRVRHAPSAVSPGASRDAPKPFKLNVVSTDFTRSLFTLSAPSPPLGAEREG